MHGPNLDPSVTDALRWRLIATLQGSLAAFIPQAAFL